MKTPAYIICFAGAAALAFGQGTRKASSPAQSPAATSTAIEVKVPDRTTVQKYNRLLFLNTGALVIGIAYAKSLGGSVDDYGRYCGEQFAPSWNKQNGFPGLARGMLANFDIFRRDDDPAVEILERTDAMIRFKAFNGNRRHFRDGKYFGVTTAELDRWQQLVSERIATEFNCTYRQETSGDFLVVTIAKHESGRVTARRQD